MDPIRIGHTIRPIDSRRIYHVLIRHLLRQDRLHFREAQFQISLLQENGDFPRKTVLMSVQEVSLEEIKSAAAKHRLPVAESYPDQTTHAHAGRQLGSAAAMVRGIVSGSAGLSDDRVRGHRRGNRAKSQSESSFASDAVRLPGL